MNSYKSQKKQRPNTIVKLRIKYVSAGCAYYRDGISTTMPFLGIGFNNNIYPEVIQRLKTDNRPESRN